MKAYIFSLYEESDYKGVVHYAIDIAPAFGNSGVCMSKKPYEDEESYRRDIEQDFLFKAPEGLRRREVARLSDNRAKYYGWTRHPPCGLQVPDRSD